ncbi:hypothetical protein B9Z19DRAFT_1196510 [Tuber borchii]|uniref:Uncharacterized protein n=1 Tax=Tuber borchii TaxID=42251 RepID=A0A2T6ZEX5_TUBBO|nr:hypothetical protein B9Z19DRAFT_1196510 [Tuber borchii]
MDSNVQIAHRQLIDSVFVSDSQEANERAIVALAHVHSFEGIAIDQKSQHAQYNVLSSAAIHLKPLVIPNDARHESLKIPRMAAILTVFHMGLFRLHESRLSVIADIGNEAWGRSIGYNTCPGQPRFAYYDTTPTTITRLPTISSPHDHLTKIQNQEFRARAKGLPIARKDNPAVKKNT